MKHKNLNLILMVSIILMISIFCMGATIKYNFTYDNSGNRTQRDTITVRLKNGDSDITALANDDDNVEIEKEQIILDKLDDLSVLIYPNPTKGMIKISISNLKEKETVKMQVYTLQGISIIDRKITGNMFELDLSDRPDGIYIVKLTTGEKQSVWKIIKE